VAGPSNLSSNVVGAFFCPIVVGSPEYVPCVVEPVGSEITRVGAAPGSDPRGGAVMIAGISVAGRGAATASPLKATKATIRSIVADPASDRKFYTKTVSNMCVAEGDHDTLHTMFE
jgi:hypothetical protein